LSCLPLAGFAEAGSWAPPGDQLRRCSDRSRRLEAMPRSRGGGENVVECAVTAGRPRHTVTIRLNRLTAHAMAIPPGFCAMICGQKHMPGSNSRSGTGKRSGSARVACFVFSRNVGLRVVCAISLVFTADPESGLTLDARPTGSGWTGGPRGSPTRANCWRPKRGQRRLIFPASIRRPGSRKSLADARSKRSSIACFDLDRARPSIPVGNAIERALGQGAGFIPERRDIEMITSRRAMAEFFPQLPDVSLSAFPGVAPKKTRRHATHATTRASSFSNI